jgi:replication fork clamp-binding protein CrfC
MPPEIMTADTVDIDVIDTIIKKTNEVSESTNLLVSIGQKMMALAPKEKDDKISNAYAKLGDALTRFGTSFSAKNMSDLEKNTGMNKETIAMLIKRAQKQ